MTDRSFAALAARFNGHVRGGKVLMKDKEEKTEGFWKNSPQIWRNDDAGCNDPVVPKMHGFPVFIGWV